MSKITVTEIAGQTSGSDQNLVKLPSNNTLQVDNIVNRGGDNDSGVDLATNDTIKLNIAGAEKARMDSSGNFMIGRTSSSSATAGAQFSADGSNIVRDGQSALTVKRLSSNGDMITLAKDSDAVGAMTNSTFTDSTTFRGTVTYFPS